MSLRRLVVAGVILGAVVSATPSGAQPTSAELSSNPAPVVETEGSSIPAATTMALLATSLVGLFLAGLQKRRKG